MKWFVLVVVFLSSVNAQASRFYTESGKIIDEGDSVGRLIMYAGDPFKKRYQVVCLSRKRDLCLNWANTEYWYYRDIKSDNLFWVITIIGDKITHMEWRR